MFVYKCDDAPLSGFNPQKSLFFQHSPSTDDFGESLFCNVQVTRVRALQEIQLRLQIWTQFLSFSINRIERLFNITSEAYLK